MSFSSVRSREGSATLTLRRQRAWGSGEPARTLSVELDVRE